MIHIHLTNGCTQGCDTLYMCHVFLKKSLHIKVRSFVENIALHKPAKEAFPYKHPNVSPGNAVDGRKTDLSGLGGQCSLSDINKTTATWWVNLGSVLSIHHITIYYRTDNVAWSMCHRAKLTFVYSNLKRFIFFHEICFKFTFNHSSLTVLQNTFTKMVENT